MASTRRHFLAGLAPLALPLAIPASAFAAEEGSYPQRPIKLVVPQPPGGPSDIVARFLAESMRASLGQPLVIDNRPGAAGLIGTAAAAAAPADGYTVLVTSRSNHIIAPLVQQGATVQPARDLMPVGLALRAVGILSTPARSPWRNLRELVAAAKAQPGRLFYGSAGIGATNHIALEQFKALAGIDLVHVPYKGAAPALTDVIAGQIQLSFSQPLIVLPHLKTGRVRALAITSAKRSGALPEFPTIAEAGVPGYEVQGWNGLFMVKDTPPAVIARLYPEVAKILRSPEVKEQMAALGAEPGGNTPAGFAAYVKAESQRWGRIIRDKGIKPE